MDTNGPLYQRTPVNLGNIVPTEFIINNQTYTSGGSGFSTNFALDIVSHNLSVVRLVAAPMENVNDEPLFVYHVVGMMTVDWPSGTLNSDGAFTLSAYMEFEPFSVNNGFCTSTITNYARELGSKEYITGLSGQLCYTVADGSINRLAGALNLCGFTDDSALEISSMSTSFRLI